MADHREEETLGKIYDTRLTRRLLQYLRPYRWQVIDGLLPPGITLSTSLGALTGVPTTPGAYFFRVRVNDSQTVPSWSERNYYIRIHSPRPLLYINVAPLAGPAPLPVTFRVYAQTFPEIRPVGYRWDFDGNGTWDYTSELTGNTTRCTVNPVPDDTANTFPTWLTVNG